MALSQTTKQNEDGGLKPYISELKRYIDRQERVDIIIGVYFSLLLIVLIIHKIYNNSGEGDGMSNPFQPVDEGEETKYVEIAKQSPEANHLIEYLTKDLGYEEDDTEVMKIVDNDNNIKHLVTIKYEKRGEATIGELNVGIQDGDILSVEGSLSSQEGGEITETKWLEINNGNIVSTKVKV